MVPPAQPAAGTAGATAVRPPPLAAAGIPAAPGLPALDPWLAGVDLALAVALLLLVAGVAGAVVPGVPGPLLSVAGVLGYWWATGYGSPGVPFLVGAVGVAAAALAVDLLGGAVAARAGGASTATTAAAVAVGFLALFVAGPLGTLAGVALTVLAVEVYRGADPREGARVAAVTLVGVLASTAVQVLLTGAILVGFLLVVLL